jgi:hypothetical protein
LLEKLIRENPYKAVCVRFGEILLSFFLPSLMSDFDFENRVTMQFELDKLGFALAAYRADRGAFPATLNELVPQYVARLPDDVFNDSPLHYRLEDRGYLLYSVGANGRDDGGRALEDDKNAGKDWDDLVVRVHG